MQMGASQSFNLNDDFASKLVESREFRSWLLSRTKFARLWPLARLMQKDQEEARLGTPWWRNWSPDVEGAVATTMLFVFEVEQTKLRFSLHVESVARAEALSESENWSYRALATAMLNQERFLNYMDFETVLLAPQALIVNDARTLNFDRRIPFETVAGFIPQFGQQRRVAA